MLPLFRRPFWNKKKPFQQRETSEPLFWKLAKSVLIESRKLKKIVKIPTYQLFGFSEAGSFRFKISESKELKRFQVRHHIRRYPMFTLHQTGGKRNNLFLLYFHISIFYIFLYFIYFYSNFISSYFYINQKELILRFIPRSYAHQNNNQKKIIKKKLLALKLKNLNLKKILFNFTVKITLFSQIIRNFFLMLLGLHSLNIGIIQVKYDIDSMYHCW